MCGAHASEVTFFTPPGTRDLSMGILGHTAVISVLVATAFAQATDPPCPPDGFTIDFDGSVASPYSTAHATLKQCYDACYNGSWAGCVGFSRYISADDNAVAACWWVTSITRFLRDDGNSNENLYIKETLRPGWVRDTDGSVGGNYHTEHGTLESCYTNCETDAWAGCVGFSRYHAVNDSDATAACWWTENVTNYILNDGNSNENLFIRDTGRAPDGWSIDYDSSVSGTYFTGQGTLQQCYQSCTDGSWINCVGFSRYINVTDDTVAACWWTNTVTSFVEDDGNDNENLYIHSKLRPGWVRDVDASVRGAFTTARATLSACLGACENGTWQGCVGFSRYHAVADTAVDACWWVTNNSEFVLDDGNSNENLYIRQCTPPLPPSPPGASGRSGFSPKGHGAPSATIALSILGVVAVGLVGWRVYARRKRTPYGRVRGGQERGHEMADVGDSDDDKGSGDEDDDALLEVSTDA